MLAAVPTGDVRARFDQRAVELEQSVALLAGLLAQPLRPAACEPAASPRRIAAARVESPRGATVCVLERDGDRVGRLHLRTGSAVNWPVLAHVTPGNLLPDFPLVNKSFELCYACADREVAVFHPPPRPPRPPPPVDAPRRRPAAVARVRHVDAGSCNGCEHELVVASSPYYDLARLRARPRRLAPPRRRAARQRRRHDADARAAARPRTPRCRSRGSSSRSATARTAAACSPWRPSSSGPSRSPAGRPPRPRLPARADDVATALVRLVDARRVDSAPGGTTATGRRGAIRP